MKSVITFLFLITVTVPVFCQEPNSKVDVEYQKWLKENTQNVKMSLDKFTHTATVQHLTLFPYVDHLGIQRVLSLQVVVQIKHKSKTVYQPSFWLFLSYNGDEWQYLNCHDFHWLVDGKTFKYQSEKYTHEMSGDGVSESFDMLLTEKQFKKLSQVQKVEGEICNDQFTFEKTQLFSIRAVDEKYEEIMEDIKKENNNSTVK